MALVHAGCGSDFEPSSPAASGEEAGAGGSGGEAGSPSGDTGTNGSETGGGGPGTGSDTSPIEDPGTAEELTEVPGVEVLLESGEKVTGQLIAEYDHSGWWVNPSKEKTIAVFDGSKFGDFPNDHSIRFLSSFDVVSVSDVDLPAGTIVYRDMLRDMNMTIGEMPIAGGPIHVAGGNGGYHADENGNGNFAWDLVRAGPEGKSFTGSGKSNTDYLVWNAPVVLPTSGMVIEVIRNAPDNNPGEFSASAEQNLIGLHLGGQYYLYLLHMRQGSIPESVKPGAVLPAGTVVGNVGNSGASIEPHLHMTLVWYDDVTHRIWSVPSEWEGMWSSSSASGPSNKHDYQVPEAGTWISSSMF